jgi:hypothetical protein
MSNAMAGSLQETFENCVIFYCEFIESGIELTEEQGRACDTFAALEMTVKDVPDAELREVAELERLFPLAFEQSLDRLIASVSDEYLPTTAADFVAKLISDTKRLAARRGFPTLAICAGVQPTS